MLETEILLNRLGITTNYKGYAILVAAVDIVYANPAALDDIMVSVYGTVAHRLGISARSVERNIRTAINYAWSLVGYRFGKVLGYKDDTPPRAGVLIRLLYENVKRESGE